MKNRSKQKNSVQTVQYRYTYGHMEKVTYHKILDEELKYRVSQNPAYSLRAFSRDLGMNPSQLSEVLKKKTGLSSKKAKDIAKKLGLSEQECQVFKALVEVEHGRSPQIKEDAQKFINDNAYSGNFRGMTNDTFKIISDWQHYAILSAMELDNYDGGVSFLANHLNVTTADVEAALKRLLKLDLIDFKDGRFVLVSGGSLTTTHDIPSNALKRFHKEHINKSLKAVDEIAVELRDITSMTMAIDLTKMKEAKELIKNFRRSLCRFLEDGPKTHVYNLNIQLIPLTDMDKKNENLH